jgi:hypothetical protein
VPLLVEEAPSVVAEMRAPATPPPPAPATAIEEGEAATEVIVTQAALEAPSEAGPSVEGVVVVLDEDSAPPQYRRVTMPRRPQHWSRPRCRRRRAFSRLWRCRCPLRQWQFKVPSRPWRWRSPLRYELPLQSRR